MKPLAYALAACMLTASGAPSFSQENLSWNFYSFPASGGEPAGATLYFGIPETDAVLFSARCRPGTPARAQIAAGLDVEGLATGQNVQVFFEGEDRSLTYPGQVVRMEEFIHGVQVTVDIDDPLWPLMAALRSVAYGVVGSDRPFQDLSLRGSQGPVQNFTTHCAGIEAPAQAAATPPAPATGTTGSKK